MEDFLNQTVGLYTDLDFLTNGEPFNVTPSNSSDANLPPMSLVADKAISIASVVVLFITMISLGCTMEISKIKAHMLRPKGVAIAVVAQYGVMPLTAFSLAKVLQLGPVESVAVLICGCCPGGALSNILALAVQGDMNLSIVMTTCSTLLALGMMPLLIYIYYQGFSNLETAVPYAGITIGLFLILVPCAIGIFLNYRVPQYSKTITKAGLIILLVSIVVIVILAGVTMHGTIFTAVSPRLMVAAAVMPLTGYMFGYILSTLFRLDGSSKRTIAMETGCQNVQLCFSILKVAFPQEVIGPLFLFPIIYSIFQAGEALVLIILFRIHQRCRAPKEEKQVYTTISSTVEEVKV